MATKFRGPLLNSSVSGLGERGFFKGLPIGNEPDWVVVMKDWLLPSELSASTDWVVTQVDAGTDAASVFAVAADAMNGELTITTNDADNDSSSAQTVNEFVKLEAGKKLWFEARWKIQTAADSDVLVGLSINDTTPLDATDRLNFKVAEGSASMSFEAVKNSTATTEASLATLADDTYVKTGFLWNGSNKVEVYVNRAKVATVTTNIPDDENLALNFMVQTGSAAARTLTVDYVMVAKER